METLLDDLGIGTSPRRDQQGRLTIDNQLWMGGGKLLRSTIRSAWRRSASSNPGRRVHDAL
jgi:hypothetical protein